MKRKNVIIIVVLLLMLNAWRWWPSDDVSHNGENESIPHAGAISLSLVSTIYKNGINNSKVRDIFQYDDASKRMRLVNATQSEQESNKKKVLVKKSVSKRVAKSNSHKLRLAGVLIKENKRHAFILSGGVEKALSEGDILNGTYKVGAISALSVKLYSLTTKHVLVLNL